MAGRTESEARRQLTVDRARLVPDEFESYAVVWLEGSAPARPPRPYGR